MKRLIIIILMLMVCGAIQAKNIAYVCSNPFLSCEPYDRCFCETVEWLVGTDTIYGYPDSFFTDIPIDTLANVRVEYWDDEEEMRDPEWGWKWFKIFISPDRDWDFIGKIIEAPKKEK